jgi:hypothetical protein
MWSCLVVAFAGDLSFIYFLAIVFFIFLSIIHVCLLCWFVPYCVCTLQDYFNLTIREQQQERELLKQILERLDNQQPR